MLSLPVAQLANTFPEQPPCLLRGCRLRHPSGSAVAASWEPAGCPVLTPAACASGGAFGLHCGCGLTSLATEGGKEIIFMCEVHACHSKNCLKESGNNIYSWPGEQPLNLTGRL